MLLFRWVCALYRCEEKMFKRICHPWQEGGAGVRAYSLSTVCLFYVAIQANFLFNKQCWGKLLLKVLHYNIVSLPKN